MNADELRAQYRELCRKEDRGTFTREDAIALVAVCIQLGELGYKLNGDEIDWYKPQIPPLYEN